MAEEKQKNKFLKDVFWKVAGVGFGLATGVFIADPFTEALFLGDFHDPGNLNAQAVSSWINTHFSWVPEIIGLRGDGGFLNTEFAQSVLSPHLEKVALPTLETVAQSYGEKGFSMDDLL
ncbi:MAG: hypothetical protein KDJ75_03120 [Alphaproteobacteria bacterium]|nr:hypothetical protein [Alphaproteobacteria bacterium]